MMPNDIETLLRSARAESFAPGFADRVASRLADERRVVALPSTSATLSRYSVRLVPAVLAASLALAAVNWWHARSTADSPLAGAIGLPSVTVASALTLDASPVSEDP